MPKSLHKTRSGGKSGKSKKVGSCRSKPRVSAEHSPKILLFDIETSPAKAWIWRTGKQYVSHNQLDAKSSFDIICICYKWAHERKVHSLDWGFNKQDSSEMINKFVKVVEDADIVIGHNGDKFDIRHINTQRLLHDQPPISWPTSEDTLKQLRRHFYFTSFKLDYVSKMLVGSGKSPMNFQDWIDIVERNSSKALNRMIKYCKNDVLKLDQVWKKIAPYCKVKAHCGIISGMGRDSCPRCTSVEYVRNGFRYTAAGKYQDFKCKSCNHRWWDTRKAI